MIFQFSVTIGFSSNNNHFRIGQQSSNTLQSQYPIFKPIPIFQTDSIENCEKPQNSFILSFTSQNVEYVAISLKSCGFKILNVKDPINPISEITSTLKEVKGEVSKFTLDQYRSILWITHSSGNVFSLDIQSKPFKFLSTLQTNNLVQPYFMDFIPGLNQVLLIVCISQIQVFQDLENTYQGQQSRDISSIKYYRSILLYNMNYIQRIQFCANEKLLFVGSISLSLNVYTLNNPQTPDFTLNLVNTLKPRPQNLAWFEVIESQNKLILQMQYGGTFTFDVKDCLKNTDAASCSKFSQLNVIQIKSKSGFFLLNQSKTFLFTQFRAFGLYILDISGQNLIPFQTIELNGDAQFLAFNSDESLLYYTNTFQFLIFKKSSVALNVNKPNILLNIIQSQEYIKHRFETIFTADPACKFDQKRNLLYLSRNQNGIAILRKEAPGIMSTINYLDKAVKGQIISMIYFFQDFTIAYIPKGINGLSIIDFTDPASPKYIQQNLNFGIKNLVTSTIQCNKQESICSYPQQFIGIPILDITDINNPVLKSIFTTKSFDISNTYSNGQFLNSKDVLIIGIFYYGLLAVDISDPSNPIELSTLFTDEATQVMQNSIKQFFIFSLLFSKKIFSNKISITSDDKYCLCTSSYQGILIVDISDLKNLKIISTVKLFGAVYGIKFIHNQQYALVTSFEKSGLFLIDIQDKYKPSLVQTYKRQKQEGLFDFCFDEDENEGYLTSNGPLLLINIKNQIILHTEIYEIIQDQVSDIKQYKSIDQNTSLFVGQSIVMYIIPLFIDSQIAVKKAELYQDYIMQPLKSWMIFSSDRNILKLSTSKDALNQDKDGKYIESTQTIIFKVYKSLLTTSFQSSFLNIDATLSAKILTELQRKGYLDDVLMVSENFSPSTNLEIEFGNIFDPLTYPLNDIKKGQIIQSIKYVMQHSIVFYPIEFKVIPSLTLDLSNPQKKYIFSIKQEVIVLISIKDKGSGKFVDKNYQGILSLISQQGDEIRLEGDLQKVNQILGQKIKFSSSIPQSQIQFQIIISDNINYDIVQILEFHEAIFISEQTKVKVKQSQSLQDDFASKIEDSSIYIQERFQYSIAPDLFYGEDQTTLVFSAQIENDEGEYIDIPLNHWLQFSQNDRVFSGLPSQREYNDVVHLQVNVTDAYSYNTQKFYIKVNKIPTIYFIQVFLQVIGPLLGILGIWRYKYKLYNAIYKKKFTYSKEAAFVGDLYSKQILINHNNLLEAQKILNYLKTCIPDKEISKQIYQLYSSVKNIKIENFSILQNQSDQLLQKFNEFKQEFQSYQKLQQIETKSEKENPRQNTIDRLKNTDENLQQNIERSNTFESIRDQQIINQDQISPLKKQIFNRYLVENTFNKNMSFNQKSKLFDENIEQSQKEINPIENSPIRNSTQINFLKSTSNEQNENMNRSKKISYATKQVNKKLKTQLSRISKYQLDQSQMIDKSKLKDSIIQKQEVVVQNTEKTTDTTTIQIFDLFGNISYDTIIQQMITRNEKNIPHDYQHLNDFQIEQLKIKNSLIRQTFEGFLAEYILSKDFFSHHIFVLLYKKASYNDSIPDWYKFYCTIQPNLDNLQQNPVPFIIFKEEEIVKNIKKYLFGFNQYLSDFYTIDKIPFSLNTLKETIKAYSLGFISPQALFKPYSSGESIMTEIHKIKQITSYQRRIIGQNKNLKNNCFRQIKQKFQRKLIEKPLIDNNKLPSWIKSVDIINNNILITGQPEKKDIGSYFIYIYSNGNFILRSFEIEVFDRPSITNINSNKSIRNKFEMNLKNQKNMFVLQDKDKSQKNIQSIFSQVNQRGLNEDISSSKEILQTNTIFDDTKRPHTNYYTEEDYTIN